MKRFLHRLLRTFRPKDSEIDAEFESLVQLHADELTAGGMEPGDARRHARKRAGNLTAAKESYRDAASLPALENTVRDIGHAWRRLRQRPVFLATAVATLAIGIGVNATVFAMVESLILRPLPFPEPRRVVTVEAANAMNMSFPNYLDLRARQQIFTHIAATRMMPVTLRDAGEAEARWSYMVTGDYFRMLGIRAWRGRLLGPEDDEKDGAHPVVVLSHARWMKEFGGADSAIGRQIRLNGRQFTIIGVTPPGFLGHLVFYAADVWVPFSMIRVLENRDWRGSRGAQNAFILGRLKDGVDEPKANAALSLLAARMAAEHPDYNEGLQLSAVPVGWLTRQADTGVRNAGAALLMVSLLTLLIACANLSGLIATHTADRRKELALRVSLGAGRAAVYRLVFAETLLVAALGGSAGMLMAVWLAKLVSITPPGIPIQLVVTPDARVFLFGTLVTFATAIGCAWFPARRAARQDALPALKDVPESGLLQRAGFRDVLTFGQIAIAVVLLSAAMMMISAFRAASQTPLGFTPRGAVLFGVELDARGYKRDQGLAMQRRILERVRALPGVTVAAYANSVPLSLDNSTTTFFVEGRPEPPASRRDSATIYQGGADIFRAMGTRLLAGRDIAAADIAGGKRVVVVNQRLANQQFPNESAIGKRIRQCSECEWLEIVGVVESGVYMMLNEKPRMAMWVPAEQSYNGSMRIVARGTVSAETLLRGIRDVVSREDPDLAALEASPYEALLVLPMTPVRLLTSLLTGMGALAALLCGLGLYGTVAYAAARRTRELGIRAALGASVGQLAFTVLRRTVLLTLAGAAAGLLLAAGVGIALANLLNTPLPLRIFAEALAGLAIVVALACAGPSARAMRVEPSSALRAD